MENGKATATENLSTGAEWLVAIGAFIYTTGFLVELVHADYLGAPGIAMDLFRTKYLLVGVLCLALPTILTAAALGLSAVWGERRHQTTAQGSGRRPLYGSSIVLAINLLLALYTYVLFAPLGYLRDRPDAIFLIFVVTIAGILVIEFVSKFFPSKLAEAFRIGGRWLLCAGIVLGLDVHCFWDLAGRLRDIFWPRGLNFVLLVISIAFVLWRVAEREAGYQSRRARHGLRILAWCVVGLVYVLAVFAFSYAIYPQIPAGRGGGDYSSAPTVVLRYVPAYLEVVPPEYRRGGASQPLILIEQTPQDIVVADPLSSGGPLEWRAGRQKPRTLSLARAAVAAIVFQSGDVTSGH